MVSETSAGAPPTVRERYVIGYREAHLALFRQRTLAMCAPFLLPHLRPGLTVLDVGCGPGSITVELAERVAPGPVVGVDIAAGQFAGARALAVERGIGTVRFEAGDAYALPFPDASVDVVFSHALISHLDEPQRALAEMRRVLKPGGLAAVSENDTGAFAIAPAGSAMERYLALGWQLQAHNGGLRLAPRHLRAALIEVGFTRVEAHAAAEAYGTPERTRLVAAAFAGRVAAADFVETVLEQGWAPRAELDGLPAGLLARGEWPDAFLAALKCGALGWSQ